MGSFWRQIGRWVWFTLLLLWSGCASSFADRSVSTDLAELKQQSGWLRLESVPLVRQTEPNYCGYAVAAMVHGYWQRHGQGEVSLATVTERLPSPDEGTGAAELRDFFVEQGFASYLLVGEFADLLRELRLGRPIIVGTVFRRGEDFIAHYVVVTGLNTEREEVLVLDPLVGARRSSLANFQRRWQLAHRLMVVVAPS